MQDYAIPGRGAPGARTCRFQRPAGPAALALALLTSVSIAGCAKSTSSSDPARNPLPSVSSVSPQSTAAGGPQFTLTVTGGNFIASSVANWNGAGRATTFVSATELRAVILATDIAAPGTAQITVFNPAPGGGNSNAQTFLISADNPLPSTSGLEPSSATAGSGAFTLTVNGSNFLLSSKVRWNGGDRLTTFVSATRLTSTIPASDVASVGTAQITVFNPAPGGGNSNAQTFLISVGNPVPLTSGLEPSSATAGSGAFTLIVNGSNFLPGSKVRWNGGDRLTTFVSATRLTSTIPASDIASAGTAQVTVFNPAPGGGTSNAQTFTITTLESQIGRWSDPFLFGVGNQGMVTVHMALMRTGKVLALDGPPEHGGGSAVLWTPPPIGQSGSGSFTSVPNTLSNMFCGGHAFLGDGRLLVIGGHFDNFVGIQDANLFDGTWTMATPMGFARWYPTATTLPDGRMLVLSGSANVGVYVQTPEIYNPTTDTWTQLTSASLGLPLYPFVFVLPDGRVLQAGSDEASTPTRALDLNAGIWSTIDSRTDLPGGSAAMYLPGKVIKAGSPGDVDIPSVDSVATTLVIDMNGASPTWRETSPMSFPRAHHNLTLLPDGSVLATGGGRNTGGVDTSAAVLEAELWSPQTEHWATMARMQTPRLYHSVGLLISDGRVAVAGGGRFAGATDMLYGEIYSPPYLFRGARPAISSTSTTTVRYGNSFAVTSPDASTIKAVTLVRPGAVTHSYNQDQRFLNLSFATAGGTLSVTAPANSNLAPPGYYMLFIINASGVPSVATFVRLQ